MTSFSDNLASIAAISDTEFSVVIGEDWLQGRTAFGGLSSAVIIEAMNRVVPQDRPLRTMAVSFIGPAPAGEHRIRLRPLREGGLLPICKANLFATGRSLRR